MTHNVKCNVVKTYKENTTVDRIIGQLKRILTYGYDMNEKHVFYLRASN